MGRAPVFVLAFANLLALSACGLKGPLYRPEERTQSTQEATVPAEPDKLRRPRPSPQVQKEDRDRADTPAEPTDRPAAPDPDRPASSTPPAG